MQQQKLWWVTTLITLGKKPIFPKEFCQAEENIVKGGIPDVAQKEIQFLYFHDIVSKVEKCDITSDLVVNINETSLKYASVGNETTAAKGEHFMTIEGSGDKDLITGAFSISFDSNFFSLQLIYGGSGTQILPR